MNLFHEYALLVAVAIPVLAIVGLNVYLWLEGERGTLLLPSARSAAVAERASEAMETPSGPVVDTTPVAIGPETVLAPANDPHVREAA